MLVAWGDNPKFYGHKPRDLAAFLTKNDDKSRLLGYPLFTLISDVYKSYQKPKQEQRNSHIQNTSNYKSFHFLVNHIYFEPNVGASKGTM